MAIGLTSLADIYGHDFDAVIDVRSPSEFAEDHLPGAINLPVLSDDERAHVGTIYVQQSAFRARKTGAALVARNAARHIEGPLLQFDGGWRPLLYCWRGGQRSGSFAVILRQIGWRADTIEGGYKAYRRLVVSRLYKEAFPSPVVLLDGNTGTAKTEILGILAERGLQVIDLERLANHRGSVLGGFGTQPSQKTFESGLAAAVAGLDPGRPVVIEAESNRIGGLNIPAQVFCAMRGGRRLFLSAPIQARAEYLTKTYGDLVSETPKLLKGLEKLTKIQGKACVAEWSALAVAGEYEALASQLIETHYDPRYRKSRERHALSDDVELRTEGLSLPELTSLADRIVDIVNG